MQAIPIIPNTITVHLGPPDRDAENVTVPFVDYVKNVVSSEIYPTWNYNAIVANTLAITSFALNRIYTEFYPSRGKNFDITSSTAIDQKFVKNRNIFENISRIVDDFFYVYIRRKGNIEPLAAKFCNGTTVTCSGLSQWGSEYMARGGSNYLDILYSYYGYDIELVYDAPIRDLKYSYPGILQLGNGGLGVTYAQIMLNRVSNAYPSIPKLIVDGKFGQMTEKAVKKFQSVFELNPDGIIGKSTWYELVRLYVGLNRLNELNSLGQKYYGVSLIYPEAIRFGDRGKNVQIIQYFINVIAENTGQLNSVAIDGIFGNDTLNAIKNFQSQNGLNVDGVVGEATWNKMYDVVKGVQNTDVLNIKYRVAETLPYPDKLLRLGDKGNDVAYIQTLLNAVFKAFNTALPVTVNGYFDTATANSVSRFQLAYDLSVSGGVDERTWNELNQQYYNSLSIFNNAFEQSPAKELKRGDVDGGEI